MDPVIRSHFKRVDPILFAILDAADFEDTLTSRPREYFVSLCRQIIGQQLSGSVADVIYERFISLFPDQAVSVSVLEKISDAQLRGVGLSGAKVRYIRDLARNVKEKAIDLTSLSKLSDDDVVSALTKISGIGPWTAEMFLMFTLNRPDVFSFGDFGLKRAIRLVYKLPKDPTIAQMKKISDRWKPYRTYAALALWKFKDR